LKKLTKSLAIITVLCLSITSCQDKQTKEELAKYKTQEAKEAANIETVKQFYVHLDKFMNEEDQKITLNLFAAESKRFGGSSGVSIPMEEMTPFLKMYYTAFPDLTHHLNNFIANGDYVAVQLKYTGTQATEFMGIPSSGKKIECKGVHIFKLDAGKITELHFVDDDLTMFTQLGMAMKIKE